MANWTRRGFLGSLSGAAAATSLAAQQRGGLSLPEKRTGHGSIKITDLKCAIIGRNPVVRIVTDQGISGYGQAESAKPYLKPMVLFYKDYLLGEDPTDVERVMLKIRRMGAFKPWGSAVSAIEIALWDIAGQAAGVPVYKLLGGKIRDRVRDLQRRRPFPHDRPNAARLRREHGEDEGSQRGFHPDQTGGRLPQSGDDARRAQRRGTTIRGQDHRTPIAACMTERGLEHVIACVEAMKKVLGDEIGLALDCGPGWTVKDAITFARALEPLHITWLEDLITGDYTPYPNAELFGKSRRALRSRFIPANRSICGRTSRTSSKNRRSMSSAPIRKMSAGSRN